MSMDTSALPFPKVRPAVVVKHEKQAEADTKLLKCYRRVDERDESVCWVTGTVTLARSENEKLRREHHHLKGRRVRPEWVTDPARVITVTAYVHKLITANALLVHGTDARKPIFFSWNLRIVKRPLFRLRPEIAKAAA